MISKKDIDELPRNNKGLDMFGGAEKLTKQYKEVEKEKNSTIICKDIELER